ncbi:hypothetical protein A3F65_01000 [Candidatus Saccharibacteria bacterium RIFCSPHIGHO2_12_FULL_47_16b]|nr:MAG: hypothetical protein A3F65_01000 [Candidatus Saccharibacteria bacterium RIFCSPHIGHO2_12_FULL_47_16b]OGL40050.1 MAG: hypothetical protein A3J32_02905 [Candidatus Saccharibacteria bacterium RIFCSPLOWO2_02_FULL_46_7]
MLKKLNRKQVMAGGIGLLVGTLIILGIRFVTYQPEKGVHYHANFAVYLNGQREEFKDIFYYIGGESCTGENDHEMTPYARAHMHDRVNDVVHVEDEAVTWGQFFQNVGWVVDPKVIRTPDKVLLADSSNKVSFMLNGEKVDNIVSRVIGDKDRLLVDFGPTSNADLEKEFVTMASNAEQYNNSPDSGTCGGAMQDKNSWRDRLKQML